MKKFLLKLWLKLPRVTTGNTLKKLRDDKSEAERALQRVIDASRKTIEAAEKQVSAREAQIIDYQEKLEKSFYDEEQKLIRLMEASVITPVEFHYSMELLKTIEKKLS